MSQEHHATGSPASNDASPQSSAEDSADNATHATPTETANDSLFGHRTGPVVEVVPVTPSAADAEPVAADEQSTPVEAVSMEQRLREEAEEEVALSKVVVDADVLREEEATLDAIAAEAKQAEMKAKAKLVAERAVEQPAAENPAGEKSQKPQPAITEPAEVVASQAVANEADSSEAASTDGDAAKTATDPFEQLGLREDVYKAIAGFGYTTPTAIQEETVSVVMSGKDVIGQAETGSGKTAAFAWPLLSKIDLKRRAPQILVLAPTRELALQVSGAFEKYGSSMKGLKTVTIYGGQSYETQFRALDRGVHVVVGTPGRIMDHLQRGTLKLDNIKTFVLDEADEMLRMGFISDVEWIMDRLPEQRQVLSFSATMPAPIRNIAKKYLSDPAHITIKSKTATADSIDQQYAIVSVREKLKQLCWLLETEETDGVIVFTKTKQTTVVVAEHLAQRGFDAAALNGDIPQNQRERVVNRLKQGKINIVVATDVAARGLDVKRVSHVINYDFPHDTEIYVHRIGRTGRAGRAGKAILFVEPKERRRLGWLEKDTKQKIGVYKPKSVDELNQIRVDKFRGQIEAAVDDKQVAFFRTLVQSMAEKTEHSIETIAAALAVMAQGATPLLLSEDGGGRGGRDSGKSGKGRSDANKQSYRIEVGRNHGVGPGNIVGAIANEGGFQNHEIGRVKLFDDFSIVDLPSNLADDVMDILRSVSVGGQRLQISKSEKTYSDSGGGRPHRSRNKSNNGSTNFTKRDRATRGNDRSRGPSSGKKSYGSDFNRNRRSISESENFRSTTPRSENPQAQKRDTASVSRSSGSKPAGGSKTDGGKPAKKYIKVRTRK